MDFLNIVPAEWPVGTTSHAGRNHAGSWFLCFSLSASASPMLHGNMHLSLMIREARATFCLSVTNSKETVTRDACLERSPNLDYRSAG